MDVSIYKIPTAVAGGDVPAYSYIKTLPVVAPVKPSADGPATSAFTSLPGSFWDGVRLAPYLFTQASVVTIGNTLGRMIEALIDPSCTHGSWIVQHHRGILVLDWLNDERVSLTDSFHLFKSTWKYHRLLHLIPSNKLLLAADKSVKAANIPESGSSRLSWVLSLMMAGATGMDTGAGLPELLPAGSASHIPAAVKTCASFLLWLRELVATAPSTQKMWRVDYSASPHRCFAVSPFTPSKPSPLKGVPTIDTSGIMHSVLIDEAYLDKGYAEVAAPAPAPSVSGHKRPRDAASAPDSAAKVPRKGNNISLAIIVPYRNQPEQNRGDQLARFAEYMPKFLGKVLPPFDDYHIFIIEQSDDGYKFNRGKTLNIGFSIASSPDILKKYGIGTHFNAFSFHDVDLFPKDVLGPYYAKFPKPPIHIASVWPRYAGNKKYVGGVLHLCEEDFKAINGFPNNMWGWGGEDDVLSNRMQAKHIAPEKLDSVALADSIIDMEEVLITEKGSGVRATTKPADGGKQEFKCFWKSELVKFHTETNHFDGLSNLKYNILGVKKLNERTSVFTVDLFGSEDPAAEKLAPIDCKLTPNEQTWRTYIDMLKAAYERRAAGETVRTPVGQQVIEALTKTS